MFLLEFVKNQCNLHKFYSNDAVQTDLQFQLMVSPKNTCLLELHYFNQYTGSVVFQSKGENRDDTLPFGQSMRVDIIYFLRDTVLKLLEKEALLNWLV